MVVKRGYKQTEVGVIPAKWTHQPLQTLGQWFNGSTPSMANATYWSGDIPWVSPKDMKVRQISNAQDHISSRAVADGARILPPGAILIVIRGMILAHSLPVARTERSVAFNQDIKAVVTGVDVDSQFLLYWLIANAHHLRSLTTESTHGTKRLPTEMLFRVLVACPPLAEQEAIAEALSDADALIESLEQLVAKKRQIKQGAMQDLLTGKKRLPRFEIKRGYKQTEVGLIPEDWDSPELGQLLKSMQLGGNYKNSERETNWPLIKMANLGRGSIRLDRLEFIDSLQGPSSRDRLEVDDVLLNTRNTLDLVGKVSIWRDELPEAYFNSNIMRLKFNEQRVSSYRFINYILNTPRSLRGLRSIAIGTTSVAAIYSRDLVKLKIPLPTQAEQEAIAEVLSDMDTEITALEAKLAKSRQIKQGMIQELLTGRIRLV